MRLDVYDAVKAIASVLPEQRPIEHHEPVINGKEQKLVAMCVQTGVTGYKYIKLLESELRKVTGATQALVVSSGTAALHLALMTAGVQEGDEVLVPTLTFVATANAVVHSRATPNFVDGILNINPYKLRCYLARETVKDPGNRRARVNRNTGRPVTALIAVHLLGIPAEMQELSDIADEFGLKLIEDAAEALGSTIGNRACGSFGSAATLSFNCNKVVTTGGGGALLTSDEWVAAKAFQLATTARMPHAWLVEHDEVAWNYRMPNLCAALGAAQLEQLPDFITRKRELNNRYKAALDGMQGIRVVEQPPGANCWLSTVIVGNMAERDDLLARLHNEGIKARALFTPLHQLPMYASNPRDNNLSYAENTFERMVCLPSGAGLVA